MTSETPNPAINPTTEIENDTCHSVRRRDPARARRDYAREARLLLQQRFRERLRIEDVARALYVSTYHLCRLFKEETGVSMHRYLNQLRLQYALSELSRGEAGLSELAMELGFSCQSHFTKAFRKEFGIPPGRVRRLAQAQSTTGSPVVS